MTCELILGGARSGKSREAERRAADSGLAVTVIATAEALDDEMAARIRRHQDDRPAGWRTVEAPLALADTLRAEAAADRCLLVACLTLWLSNLLADAHTLPDGVRLFITLAPGQALAGPLIVDWVRPDFGGAQ